MDREIQTQRDLTCPRSYIRSEAVRTRIHLICNLAEAYSCWGQGVGRGWHQRMAYQFLGVLGPGMDGRKELTVFSSGVVEAMRGVASWELSSSPRGPGCGRGPCGLMCGVPASSGGLSSSCSPQLSKVQESSVGCTVSIPFAAW